jgi:hypothetical protein
VCARSYTRMDVTRISRNVPAQRHKRAVGTFFQETRVHCARSVREMDRDRSVPHLYSSVSILLSHDLSRKRLIAARAVTNHPRREQRGRSGLVWHCRTAMPHDFKSHRYTPQRRPGRHLGWAGSLRGRERGMASPAGLRRSRWSTAPSS